MALLTGSLRAKVAAEGPVQQRSTAATVTKQQRQWAAASDKCRPRGVLYTSCPSGDLRALL
jgi:hypothetical protein